MMDKWQFHEKYKRLYRDFLNSDGKCYRQYDNEQAPLIPIPNLPIRQLHDSRPIPRISNYTNQIPSAALADPLTYRDPWGTTTSRESPQAYSYGVSPQERTLNNSGSTADSISASPGPESKKFRDKGGNVVRASIADKRRDVAGVQRSARLSIAESSHTLPTLPIQSAPHTTPVAPQLDVDDDLPNFGDNYGPVDTYSLHQDPTHSQKNVHREQRQYGRPVHSRGPIPSTRRTAWTSSNYNLQSGSEDTPRSPTLLSTPEDYPRSPTLPSTPEDYDLGVRFGTLEIRQSTGVQEDSHHVVQSRIPTKSYLGLQRASDLDSVQVDQSSTYIEEQGVVSTEPEKFEIQNDTESQNSSSLKEQNQGLGGRGYRIEDKDTVPHISDRRYMYQRHGPRFFSVGRVFAMMWHDSSGQDGTILSGTVSKGKYGEHVYSSIRRMIVVREAHGSCWCIPVTTYSGRGVAKPGLNPKAHAIVYASGTQPKKLPTEPALSKEPLEIELARGSKLHERSRVNFEKVYTVEHNVKVMDVGKVSMASMPKLMEYWRLELG